MAGDTSCERGEESLRGEGTKNIIKKRECILSF